MASHLSLLLGIKNFFLLPTSHILKVVSTSFEQLFSPHSRGEACDFQQRVAQCGKTRNLLLVSFQKYFVRPIYLHYYPFLRKLISRNFCQKSKFSEFPHCGQLATTLLYFCDNDKSSLSFCMKSFFILLFWGLCLLFTTTKQ